MTETDVAYVLLHFPCLTETFIAEEIRGVQQKGVNIHLYSLLPATDEIIHPVSRQLSSKTKYVPGLLHPSLIGAQAYYLTTAPGKYLYLLKTILGQPAPEPSFIAKRLVIFLKSIWLARQLAQTPVQLVHTHFAWLSTVAGVVVSQLLDIPFTVTAHAYDIYSCKNDLLPLAAQFADRIVTISNANRKAICAMNSRLCSDKVEVLRCGIDLDYFQAAPKELAGRNLRITSIGSLIGKKGHEYLIRACGILRSRHLDFQCVIIGRGELEDHLSDLIQELGLENCVCLVGAQPQEKVREHLRASDLFVLACVSGDVGGQDGIPVALMEAMGMAVPVISTYVSGIPELVRNEETGLLVPERNEEMLADAICRLSSDSELRNLIVRNGLDLIHKEYDISKNTDHLSILFKYLAGAQYQGAKP